MATAVLAGIPRERILNYRPVEEVTDVGARVEGTMSRVEISRPDKVLWPEPGISKQEYADYLDAVGDLMLPWVRERPLTLVRAPDGVEGQRYFQKDTPSYAPDWIRTVTIPAPSAKRDVHYVVCNDRDTLRWLGNQAALEFHLAPVRRDRLDRPDLLVVDIDPPDDAFDAAVEVALLVVETLHDLEVSPLVKTTGGKGLHVVVPVERRIPPEEFRQAASALTALVAERRPDLITDEFRKAKRAGRVMLDPSRNGTGATVVAPYSPRANANATVAFPVDPASLRSIAPSDFTIRTVPGAARLGRASRLAGGGVGAATAVARQASAPLTTSSGGLPLREPGKPFGNEPGRSRRGFHVAEVVLDDVAKVYPDGTQAVSDLDLRIDDGEFMVFVGPSGCGKTTALRMVAGLEDITSGTIAIGDRVVNDVPSKDRDVAMVFQNYALYPHLKVYDNMAFGLQLRKIDKSEIDRRVRDAAKVLGLEELLDRKPKNLSGGQRQRVAMGRAIVREPRAFLMDEPLSNLDAKLRVQMRAEIARLQDDLGVTTIYVTHDQTEAMTMGDRVAVIKQGRLQQVDIPQVLYDEPVNLFVAGFIGSPAMNMIEATLDRDDAGWGVSFAGIRLGLDDETVSHRAALARFEGRQVIVGIRPEDMEDAAIHDDARPDRVLTARVDLREALGSEVLVHFTVDAPPVLTEDTRELARDAGVGELETERHEGRSPFVARLSPRTEAQERQDIQLVVDTSRMHFFDPETGSGIYDETG